jgi:hypothetical protein
LSRILCLPCREDTLRGYSRISLLIIDEAARVPDDLYRIVRPIRDPTMTPTPIRNRIKAHRRIRAGDLVPHEWNFRAHPDVQRAALSAQYQEIGFAPRLAGLREARWPAETTGRSIYAATSTRTWKWTWKFSMLPMRKPDA